MHLWPDFFAVLTGLALPVPVRLLLLMRLSGLLLINAMGRLRFFTKTMHWLSTCVFNVSCGRGGVSEFKEESMMKFILLLLIIAAIALVLSAIKAKTRSDDGDGMVWPFYAKNPLSVAEQVLYFRLLQALPGHIVLAQVQLSCLLGVMKGHNYQSWLNRISRMSADFVVCLKDGSIVAVIELDDATHKQERRQQADAKKDKALASAGIRVIRWQAGSIPDEAAIRAALRPVVTLEAEQD